MVRVGVRYGGTSAPVTYAKLVIESHISCMHNYNFVSIDMCVYFCFLKILGNTEILIDTFNARQGVSPI
jgi:hypothetical protein